MGYAAPVHKQLDSNVAWWTLLMTIVIAFIYGCQLLAMRDSNKITREALESVQRASVTFSSAIETRIINNPTTHKAIRWDFIIPVKNNGATQTKEMTVRINKTYGHDKLADDFQYPDSPDSSTQPIVLGAHEQTDTAPVSVTPDIIEALESVPFGGSYHVYFYGWAKYRDVFAGTPLHVTEFCYELTENPANPGKEEFHPAFTPCPHHNCTDDECKTEQLKDATN